MPKPVIFYFVHAHGNGHSATFHMLYPALSMYFKVIAISSNNEIADHLYGNEHVEVIQLPQKYPPGYHIPEHTFSKAFEVTPYAIEPAYRVKALAEAITRYRPKAFYCDGVPEIAIMVRGMGVPVILVHLPGNIMKDPTQVFAHELADHIVAHFPVALEQSDYHFGPKTFYSGYISKYAGSDTKRRSDKPVDDVTVLLGHDNCEESVLKKITQDEETQFTIIGNKRGYDLNYNCRLLGRVNNISDAIAGEVVISAAGQNSIAELLSLNKRLILLPEPRPYEEQAVHAGVLADRGIALLAQETFSALQWREVRSRARLMNSTIDGLVNKFAPRMIAQKVRDWYA